MKKIKVLLMAVFLTSVSLFSNAQQKDNWKEMQDFHAVMSKTFHPAEENNLQPVKENADELVAKSKEWKKSVVPEGYNAELTKPIIDKLVKQCTDIKKAAAKRKATRS